MLRAGYTLFHASGAVADDCPSIEFAADEDAAGVLPDLVSAAAGLESPGDVSESSAVVPWIGSGTERFKLRVTLLSRQNGGKSHVTPGPRRWAECLAAAERDKARGSAHFAAGRHERAVARYRSAIEGLRRATPDTDGQIASTARTDAGGQPIAETDGESALVAACWNNSALAQLKLGDFTAAAASAGAALAIDPDNTKAHFRAGEAAVGLGDL